MENNCLLRTLKAATNNPNLPDLEVMQQFTLDIITASGNNSMSDSEKWALNHFFYQIGAIDNTGIYPKLKILNLAIITSDLVKVFNNYAPTDKNPRGISNNISLINKGVVGLQTSGHVAATTLCSGDCEDIFFGLVSTSEEKNTINIKANTNAKNITSNMSSSGMNISVSPYESSSVPIKLSFSATGKIVGSSICAHNEEITACYIDSISVTGNIRVSSTKYFNEVSEAIVNDFEFKAMPEHTEGGLGAAFVGFGVTADEQLKFMAAIRELFIAFGVDSD